MARFPSPPWRRAAGSAGDQATGVQGALRRRLECRDPPRRLRCVDGRGRRSARGTLQPWARPAGGGTACGVSPRRGGIPRDVRREAGRSPGAARFLRLRRQPALGSRVGAAGGWIGGHHLRFDRTRPACPRCAHSQLTNVLGQPASVRAHSERPHRNSPLMEVERAVCERLTAGPDIPGTGALTAARPPPGIVPAAPRPQDSRRRDP